MSVATTPRANPSFAPMGTRERRDDTTGEPGGARRDLVSVTPAGEPRSLRVSAPGSRRSTTPGATGLEEEHDAGLKEQNTHSPGWMAGGSS